MECLLPKFYAFSVDVIQPGFAHDFQDKIKDV